MIYEIKIEFLPSIEALRRAFNWSLHLIVEDELQHNKNSIFIHSKLEIFKNQAPNQDPLHQTKSSDTTCWSSIMLRTQTLNAQTQKREKEIRIYEMREDAYVSGVEEKERNLLVYTRL